MNATIIRRRIGPLVTVLTALGAVAMVAMTWVATPARAAFPGRNGKIAFVSYDHWQSGPQDGLRLTPASTR